MIEINGNTFEINGNTLKYMETHRNKWVYIRNIRVA